MRRQTWYERMAACLAIVSVGLLVSGTKACQEDYDLASQSTLKATTSATPTDDDDGDGTFTQTPLPGVTLTPTPPASGTGTPDATATTDDGLSAALSTTSDSNLFTQLSQLSETPAPVGGQGAGAAAALASDPNWLGESFSDKSNAGSGGSSAERCADGDNDGFSDAAEDAAGTDSADPNSAPPAPGTKLSDRLRGIDTDFDGLSDTEDPNPTDPDTDKDGRPDGAEVLSGGNPREAGDKYADDDEDGLANSFEDNRGTDSSSRDTDSDGLTDAQEFAVGTDPRNCDSDGDGVFDGAEVNLFQSDPTRSEAKK